LKLEKLDDALSVVTLMVEPLQEGFGALGSRVAVFFFEISNQLHFFRRDVKNRAIAR
jgi:hypothetical protein